MAECNSCGAHVSERYHRVKSDNEGVLHKCQSCSERRPDARTAAGLNERRVKTTQAGFTTPAGGQ